MVGGKHLRILLLLFAGGLAAACGMRESGAGGNVGQRDDEAAPRVGNATHFDSLGSGPPYGVGACGVPTNVLETGDFVALNVQNTPGDYGSNGMQRPLKGADAAKMGLYRNGLNCGRWVQVTLGDFCTGINDGAPGKGFCRSAANTPWVDDGFNGGVLNMIVTDSCQDTNEWCRDDPNHLDLATDALAHFKKDGRPLPNLLPDHWGNRHIDWHFIQSPQYQGDIQIGFGQNSQRYWASVIVSRLPNGIHGVQFKVGGAWQNAAMNADQGQIYLVPSGAQVPLQMRVVDADDQLLHGGRIYEFSLPGECGASCRDLYTPVNFRSYRN